MRTFQPGERFYKYELISLLGKGSFGEVWKANDTFTDQIRAVKILHAGSFDMSLLDEAKNGCRYTHKHLLKIHFADVLNIENQTFTFIAQDFHPKGSITNFLNPQNFLSIKKSVKSIIDILCALEHLHQNNFLHNDIKPSNILLDENDQSILADFGISANFIKQEGVTAPNIYMPHCAPETHNNNLILPQTDISEFSQKIYIVYFQLRTPFRLQTCPIKVFGNTHRSAVGRLRIFIRHFKKN